MTNREILANRFNALVNSIAISRLYLSIPNSSADERVRHHAHLDEDVAAAMKLSRLIAEVDMKETVGAFMGQATAP